MASPADWLLLLARELKEKGFLVLYLVAKIASEFQIKASHSFPERDWISFMIL
jgi:hypothetical protein